MSLEHDNARDRQNGALAEVEAAGHLHRAGYQVERHPLGPTGFDLLVVKAAPRFIEVRCKYPDRHQRYGLERWKLPMWHAADVVYCVKDTRRGGWWWSDIRKLPDPEDGPPGSYRGGKWEPDLPNAYWPVTNWLPLKWAPAKACRECGTDQHLDRRNDGTYLCPGCEFAATAAAA